VRWRVFLFCGEFNNFVTFVGYRTSAFLTHFTVMRHFFLLCLLALFTNFSCQTDDPTTTDGQAPGKQLSGKWLLVKSDVLLKFDDGTTQSVSVPGSGTDYLELQWSSKSGIEEKGTIKNVYLGDESTGDWVYIDQDKSLDITYTSLSPHYFIYRKIEKVDDKTLILTADDSKVMSQYTNNGLNDFGVKKLIGGSIREEWKR
jgi:hypothetical protein